jgi:hypothetical protein
LQHTLPQSGVFPPRAGKKTKVILRQGQQPAGQKLKSVPPIVLNNGQPRWSAATNISQLIEPPPRKLRLRAAVALPAAQLRPLNLSPAADQQRAGLHGVAGIPAEWPPSVGGVASPLTARSTVMSG